MILHTDGLIVLMADIIQRLTLPFQIGIHAVCRSDSLLNGMCASPYIAATTTGFWSEFLLYSQLYNTALSDWYIFTIYTCSLQICQFAKWNVGISIYSSNHNRFLVRTSFVFSVI
jgi:hypothetical protein